MSTELREVSYGGVVVRGDEVVVIRPRGRRLFALPKGGAAPGEQGAEAAARETREETGIEVAVVSELGTVDYNYRRAGRKVAKSVDFFLFRATGGSTDDHDHEVDEACWISLERARSELAYAGERAMIERALTILAANG